MTAVDEMFYDKKVYRVDDGEAWRSGVWRALAVLATVGAVAAWRLRALG